MKSKILYLFSLLLLVSCTSKYHKTSVEIWNLKGHVKSIKKVAYGAQFHFGEVQKVSPTDYCYLGFATEPCVLIVEFDKSGNQILYKSLNSYDKIKTMCESKWDKSRVCEEILYRESTDSKVKIVYDANSMGYNGASYVYDANDKLLSHNDFFYDAKGHEIEVKGYDSISELSYRIEKIWDGDLLVKEVGYYKEFENSITYDYVDGKLSSSVSVLADYSPNTTLYNEFSDPISYSSGIGQYDENFSYKYTYDEKGNWITRTTFGDGKPYYIEEREIEYY